MKIESDTEVQSAQFPPVTTVPSTCDALATAENTDLRLPNSVTRGG